MSSSLFHHLLICMMSTCTLVLCCLVPCSLVSIWELHISGAIFDTFYLYDYSSRSFYSTSLDMCSSLTSLVFCDLCILFKVRSYEYKRCISQKIWIPCNACSSCNALFSTYTNYFDGYILGELRLVGCLLDFLSFVSDLLLRLIKNFHTLFNTISLFSSRLLCVY